MDWREWISVQPEVCHGEPCCAGTRVTASVVLANLAAGLTADEILRSYPTLVPEHVPASMAYAAHLAEVGEGSGLDSTFLVTMPRRNRNDLVDLGT